MADGVRAISFQGSIAWAITWRGEELQMYWGSDTEARCHLWLLNHPDAAESMCRNISKESGVPFVKRFAHLRNAYYQSKNKAA